MVHDSGLAETAVGETDLPNITGTPLEGDDAGGYMPGDPAMRRDVASPSVWLAAAYSNMVRPPAPLPADAV